MTRPAFTWQPIHDEVEVRMRAASLAMDPDERVEYAPGVPAWARRIAKLEATEAALRTLVATGREWIEHYDGRAKRWRFAALIGWAIVFLGLVVEWPR
jgi:hypothetical protein